MHQKVKTDDCLQNNSHETFQQVMSTLLAALSLLTILLFMNQLVHAFFISRLDYYNSILASLPKCLLSQLQQIQNVAAKLVLGLQPYSHIKPVLFELH